MRTVLSLAALFILAGLASAANGLATCERLMSSTSNTTLDQIEFRGLSFAPIQITDLAKIYRFTEWLRSLTPVPTGSYPATTITVVGHHDGVTERIVELSLPIGESVYVNCNGHLYTGTGGPITAAPGTSAFDKRVLLYGQQH